MSSKTESRQTNSVSADEDQEAKRVSGHVVKLFCHRLISGKLQSESPVSEEDLPILLTGKSNFPFSPRGFTEKKAATQEHLCCGCTSASERITGKWRLKGLHGSEVRRESDAYVKVVLQEFWSGSIAGGEAKVVLKGVSVGQELLCSLPRVRQLASDGTELL